MKVLFIFFVLLAFPVMVVAADYEAGSFQVSKLRFGSGGVYVAVKPAPMGCGGGNHYRMHFKVNNVDSLAYKDMVAGLLSANATGQKIQFLWYQNKGVCSSSNVLILDMFEFAEK